MMSSTTMQCPECPTHDGLMGMNTLKKGFLELSVLVKHVLHKYLYRIPSRHSQHVFLAHSVLGFIYENSPITAECSS